MMKPISWGLRGLVLALPALALAACGDDVDWAALAGEACGAEFSAEQCQCMVDRLDEEFSGDDQTRMVAALAASFEGTTISGEQLESLEMTAAEFGTFRTERERQVSRLRRSCTEG